jgi:WD40 repeat protein
MIWIIFKGANKESLIILNILQKPKIYSMTDAKKPPKEQFFLKQITEKPPSTAI